MSRSLDFGLSSSQPCSELTSWSSFSFAGGTFGDSASRPFHRKRSIGSPPPARTSPSLIFARRSSPAAMREELGRRRHEDDWATGNRTVERGSDHDDAATRDSFDSYRSRWSSCEGAAGPGAGRGGTSRHHLRRPRVSPREGYRGKRTGRRGSRAGRILDRGPEDRHLPG